MLFTLLFLQSAVVAPAATPPVDWTSLAPLPYIAPPQLTPAVTRFVADEIAAARCRIPRPADGHYVLRLDIAALVDAQGRLARIVPRAIGCPTVEQYGVGLVQRFARDNLQSGATGGGDHWYRATLVFDWAG